MIRAPGLEIRVEGLGFEVWVLVLVTSALAYILTGDLHKS